jgi:hypothetical protein
MAYMSGTAGSVVYMTGGTARVGGLAEWSMSINMSTVETTSFSDQFDTFVPSTRGASGSFTGSWDPTDSAQTSMVNASLGGSAVALRLYTNGSAYWNIGTAYLNSMETGISQKGKGDLSFNFTVSGPVTLA